MQKKKPRFKRILLKIRSHGHNYFFFALLFSLGIFTELFYHPQSSLNIKESFLTLPPKLKSDEILGITLQNKTHLLKLKKDGVGIWYSTNQDNNRRVPLREDYINSLLSSLSSFNVQKKLPNDSMNRTNFSLNDPLLSLTISTISGDLWNLKVGITNPLTKSSYVTFNDSPYLFQIDMVNSKIINFHKEALIDDKIFTYSTNNLLSLHYDFIQQNISESLILKKHELQWVSQTGKPNNLIAVNELFRFIKTIKSAKIISQESISKEFFEDILKSLYKPVFRITFAYETETQTFEGILLSNSQRNLASKKNLPEYFWVKEKSREELYLMSKDDFQELLTHFKNLNTEKPLPN